MVNIQDSEVCFWKIVAQIESERVTLESKRGMATYIPKEDPHPNIKDDKVNDCCVCMGGKCKDYFEVPLELLASHLRSQLQEELKLGKLEISQGPETNLAYAHAANTFNDQRKCEILQIHSRATGTEEYNLIAQFYWKHPNAYNILETIIGNSK